MRGKMLRVRFYTDGSDYRPVKFPPPYPYWCSGETIGQAEDGSDDRSVVVAYIDSVEQLLEFWPDAEKIDVFDQDAKISFTDRFQKPDWWNP
jgi:hypothetical protein